MRKLTVFLISFLLIGRFLNAQTKNTKQYDAVQRVTEVHFQDKGYDIYTYDKVNDKM